MSAQPPVDMVAPSAAHTTFYILFFAQAAVAIAVLAWRARAGRTWLPWAALGGALVVGYFAPPILNRLTYVWFPSNIPLPYMEAFGMKDPLFDLIGYALFFGFGGWMLSEAIRAGHGARVVWLFALGFGVADLLYEIPFIAWGMFTYYGDQPFTIGGFPLHWVINNAMVPVLAGTLMYLVLDRVPLRGAARPAALAAVPAVTYGVLTIPVTIVGTTLNADLPGVAPWLAAIVSITIALSVMWLCATVARQAATGERRASVIENDSVLTPENAV